MPRVGSDGRTGTSQSTEDDRATARLGNVTFDKFEHPQLTPSGSARTVSHDVLPQNEDDDRGTVVQALGEEARTFELRGTCLQSTVGELMDMLADEVGLRHSLFSGTVLVKNVDPSSLEGARDEDGAWYTFRVELVEVA